jgi:hypothetical protein
MVRWMTAAEALTAIAARYGCAELCQVVTEEMDALRHDIERHVAICAEQATELERLRQDLAAARADAERYRHLRDFHMPHHNVRLIAPGFPRSAAQSPGWKSWIDAEVDAAINASLAGKDAP